MADLAVGLTGSVNTTKPSKIRSHSSAAVTPVPSGMNLWATARTRIPLVLYHSTSPMMSLTVISSRTWMSLFSSMYPVDMLSISATAPFVIIMSTSSFFSTTTDALLLMKSKGTSATNLYASSSSSSPSSSAYSSIAQSIWFVDEVRFLLLRQE